MIEIGDLVTSKFGNDNNVGLIIAKKRVGEAEFCTLKWVMRLDSFTESWRASPYDVTFNQEDLLLWEEY